VGRTLARHGLYPADLKHAAIHPGGSRILDGIAACLELTEAQMAHSRRVLHERGNMSSATLPHIWARMAADPAVRPGELILSLAFGPGLTVTGNILRKES
jgi:predicted naringenin-chalcone synthase